MLEGESEFLSCLLLEVISSQFSEEALCKAIAHRPLLNTGNRCHKQSQLEAVENTNEKEDTVMLKGIHLNRHSMSKNH